MSEDVPLKTQKEESFGITVERFFFQREALLIGLMTASVYLCTYFFTRSHLQYFGVTSEFVEITSGDVLIFGSVIVTSGFLVVQALGLFPVIAIVPFLKLLLVISPAVVPMIWSWSFFSLSGFTWVSISFLLVTILLTVAISFSLVDVLRRKKTFLAWLESEVDADTEIQKKFVTHHLISGAGALSFFVYFCFLLAPICSHLSGIIYASSRVNFTFIEMSGEQYVVVSDLSDGLMLAGVSQTSPSGTFHLNGRTNWLPFESMSKQKVTIRSFPEGISFKVRRSTWTTFRVFWERNFGGPIPDRP